MNESSTALSPGARGSLVVFVCCSALIPIALWISGSPAVIPLSHPLLPVSMAFVLPASIAGITINRLTRARQTLTRKLQEADELQRVSSRVASENSMQEAAEVILRAVRQMYPGASAALIPISPAATDTAWQISADEPVGAGAQSVSVVHMGNTASQQPKFDARFRRIEDLSTGLRPFAAGCKAAAVVPVTLPNGTVIALVTIGFASTQTLSKDELHWLTTFGRGVAVPLERVRMQEELAQLAYTDPMTGLANFRSFRRQLHDECERASRYGHPLSLLILDIDHFKSVNDGHGHPAGDDVLRQVAEVLRGHVRSIDLPARYGGEEFAVLCPETEMEAALNLAERLRVAVEALECTLPSGGTLAVTISIGAASLSEMTRSETKLVESADCALYEAKRKGRNRVVPADAKRQSVQNLTAA